jgi:hypothetical protein
MAEPILPTAPLLPLLDAPSFDVDESIAALVLQHVDDPLDRFALAGVSQVWRKVATSSNPSMWPKHVRLLLQGAIAAKLTDERVEQLLEYAGPNGNLRAIEIQGAPPAFTGEGLCPYFEQPPSLTPQLHTIDLSGCAGVQSWVFLALLSSTGIDNRPRNERLDKLGLDLCHVQNQDVHILDTFVRHSRSSSRDKFDYWLCEICEEVVEKCFRCESCGDQCCHDCESNMSGGAYIRFCEPCRDPKCSYDA